MEFPQFCRACACVVNEPCEIENNPAKPELSLLIKQYVPELNIDVEDARLCIECVSVLYIFHDFKRKCLRTEEDLRSHIRKYPEVTTVNFNEIFLHKEQKNIASNTIELSSKTSVTSKQTIKEETIEPHPQASTTISTSRKKYKCKICCRLFSTEKSLRDHVRSFHERPRYQCDKCSRDFAKKRLYDVHLAYHEDPDAGRFICEKCNFVYQSLAALNRHIIGTHKSVEHRPFQCEVCTRRFIENADLVEHMETHLRTQCDTEAKRKVLCDICRRFFSSEKSLRTHIQRYHGRERYQCDKCSRDFVFKEKFYKHLEFHKKPIAERYRCEVCNFSYHSYHSLRLHNLQKHSSEDEKPFRCEVCAKRFVGKNVLTVHMKTLH